MDLSRQTSWLLLILVAVIIAAAVGGGVGGSLAVQKAKWKADSASQSTVFVTLSATNAPSRASTLPLGYIIPDPQKHIPPQVQYTKVIAYHKDKETEQQNPKQEQNPPEQEQNPPEQHTRAIPVAVIPRPPQPPPTPQPPQFPQSSQDTTNINTKKHELPRTPGNSPLRKKNKDAMELTKSADPEASPGASNADPSRVFTFELPSRTAAAPPDTSRSHEISRKIEQPENRGGGAVTGNLAGISDADNQADDGNAKQKNEHVEDAGMEESW